MAQFLVAIHRPTAYDPFKEEDKAMGLAIDKVNDEMNAKGIIAFVGGLQSESTAVSIRRQADGKLATGKGPYLKTNEHVGGFWVLNCANIDEAIEWGRKAAVACKADVEVRPFHSPPTS